MVSAAKLLPSSLPQRWSQEFHGVAAGRMAEGDRIDRAGIGKTPRRSGLTDLGGEVLEPGGGDDLQRAQRLVGTDEEGVGQVDRQQHEVTRTGVEEASNKLSPVARHPQRRVVSALCA